MALLFFVTAPYGRHLRSGWGPTVAARWGWLVMEAPAPVGFALGLVLWADSPRVMPFVLAALWMLHYIHRAFVFPFRMRGATKKRMPLVVVGLAILFNTANASVNTYAIAQLSPHLQLAWLADPRFGLGLVLFFTGFGINRHSDAILRNLRGPGETAYRIPHGGLFRWVSCPNYLGEILQWAGFAIAAWTLAAAVFVWFTLANLVPRALAHHRWYRETFPEYPKARRALVPLVF
jgi:uncharacterized membrane protein